VRIGLVVYGSLDAVSGGNLYDQKLVESLRGRSHEVEILSLSRRGYVLDLAQNLSPSLGRRLVGTPYDLLLQDELTHPSLVMLNESLRRLVAYPLVAIVHHLRSSEDRPTWQNALYRRVEKRYLESVDAFVFNSHTTRESVESLLAKKTRNVVAPPGGDRLARETSPGEVEDRARERGELRLLFVGNVIARKGLHDLVEALALLRDIPFRLEVVGSCEMEPAYAKRVHERIVELGLADRVRFHGTLTGENLAACFRDAQVLVVPSSYEGFGIVYLEAMGFGLPVIASAAGATEEIVRHEVTGFLVQPGDVRSLSLRIESLLEDRELLARLSLASLRAFDDHPGWKASLSRVGPFLEEITSRPSRP
jgi:glycosyltransferase involved in cell wall biosynthesis